MAKGKFEKSRTAKAQPAANKAPRKAGGKGKKKLWIAVSAAAVAVLLIAVGAYILLRPAKDRTPEHIYVAGVDIAGMSETEAVAAVQEAVAVYRSENLNVFLFGTPAPEAIHVTYDAEDTEEPADSETGEPEESASTAPSESDAPEESTPDETTDPDFPDMVLESTLCLQAADVAVTVDVERAVADAQAIRGCDEYTANVSDYMTLNDSYITELVESFVAESCTTLSQPTVRKGAAQAVTTTDDDGEESTHMADTLEITLGTRGRSLDTDALYAAILSAYTEMEFTVKLAFEDVYPDSIDLDEIYTTYCKAAVDASYDEETFEVIPEVEGYGFDKREAAELLSAAQSGETVTLVLDTIAPEYTKEYLKSRLFADLLGKYDTWHSDSEGRTNNLILACKAINGKVLLPGETFSFNGVVGQRTAAKGYKEAAVYVGMDTVGQLGGGVCQVASTIYCAALYADMEIVERTAHTFYGGYTPGGMDATVYYGSLDFKFKNSSDFPIKMEAWVAGKQVHIRIYGTKTNDYTVKMDCVKTGEDPYQTLDYIIKDGETYLPGDTVVSGYNGSTWTTYRVYVDANGNEISRQWEANSSYRRRDQKVAVEDPSKVTTPEPSDTPEPTETQAPPETPEPSDTTEPIETPELPVSSDHAEARLPHWDWSQA